MKGTVKIVIVGNPYSGKTTLILKLIGDVYERDYEPSFGSTFYIHLINGRKLEIWDTGGDVAHRSITSLYYKEVDIIILMCNDITQGTLDSWLIDIEEKTNVPIFLIVNKFTDEQTTIEMENVYFGKTNKLKTYVLNIKKDKGLHEIIDEISEYHIRKVVSKEAFTNNRNCERCDVCTVS